MTVDLERSELAPRYFRPPNQSSPPREVIDLTRDPPSVKGDNDDGGDVTTKVSWFSMTRMTRCRVRLIPPSLIGRFQVVDQLPPAPTVPPQRSHPPHTADGSTTSSTPAPPGRGKRFPWKNIQPWSPKYRTPEQHSTAPLDHGWREGNYRRRCCHLPPHTASPLG